MDATLATPVETLSSEAPSTPEARLDLPLVDFLESLTQGGKQDLNDLKEDVLLWCERREEMKDIDKVDGARKEELQVILAVAKEIVQKQEAIQQEKERRKRQWRSICADAEKKALQAVDEDPLKAELVRSNIEQWRIHKEAELDTKLLNLMKELEEQEEVLSALVWEILAAICKAAGAEPFVRPPMQAQ